MNTKQKLHQANLAKWTAIFKEQADSGLTVKQFCSDHDLSIHAYNYWKHMAKEAYVESILPDIVPISAPVPDPVSVDKIEYPEPSSCDLRESRESLETKTSSTEPVSVMIRDIRIEIGSSASDEMIAKIIKAVRYA